MGCEVELALGAEESLCWKLGLLINFFAALKRGNATRRSRVGRI